MLNLKLGKYGHKSPYLMNVETGELLSKTDAIDQFLSDYVVEGQVGILNFDDLFIPSGLDKPCTYYVISRDVCDLRATNALEDEIDFSDLEDEINFDEIDFYETEELLDEIQQEN